MHASKNKLIGAGLLISLMTGAVDAQANQITGVLDVFVKTTFINPDIVRYDITSNTGFSTVLTGDFAPFGPNLAVTPQNAGAYIFVSQIGNSSNLFCGLTCVMYIGGAGLQGWLNVTHDVYDPVTGIVNGEGIMNLVGFDPTPAAFSLGVNFELGGLENFSVMTFSSTPVPPAPVPGPIVGAGIPGIAAALGLFGFHRFRRRRSSQIIA
jgi:hypothetical protein